MTCSASRPPSSRSCPGSVRLVADPRVEPAGAVAETGVCRVDAQLGPALERVREVLRS